MLDVQDVFGLIFNFWVGFAVLAIVLVKQSIKFVPQNRAYVVERFGNPLDCWDR